MKKRGAILTIRIDGLYIGRKKIAGIDPGDGSSPVIMGDIVVNHYKLEKIPFQLGRMTDNKKAYGANYRLDIGFWVMPKVRWERS